MVSLMQVEKEGGAAVPVCEEGEGVVAGGAAAASGGGGGVKRQIFEEEEEECHQMFAAETPVTTLPLKRRAGRPKKHPVREKMEESEASEAGRNWPDSEVYALIDVRGEMEPDFVKNAKKQGQSDFSPHVLQSIMHNGNLQRC